jgi:hypothetical protein
MIRPFLNVSVALEHEGGNVYRLSVGSAVEERAS